MKVSEELAEFVEELIMGDSSGDEKIDPDDMGKLVLNDFTLQ